MATTIPDPVLDARDEDLVAAQAIGALPSELSDRSDSNPAVVLLEAASWIYGKLSYQLNQWPRAVVQKAMALVGVTLEDAAAATTSLTFTLTAPVDRDKTIDAGTEVATTDGAILFATLDDLTIDAYTAGGGGTIAFTAGSTAVVGTGTAFLTGSAWVAWQIGLQGASGAAPTTWNTIASVTNGTNLTLSAPAAATTSGAFFVGPLQGSTTAQATTTGSTTNVGAGKLTSLQSSVSGVASVTNNAAATGGQDQETAASAVLRAPTAFASRDVACSAADHAEFARRILGQGGRAAARANTNLTAAATGYTTVALLSPTWTTSTPVTTAEQAAVDRDLEPRRYAGVSIVVTPATLYLPTPACIVVKKAQYADAQVRSNVAGAINTWLSPNTYPWGRVIYPMDLASASEAAEGVDRVHEIKGVACCGTGWTTVPSDPNWTNGNATATIADTTWVVDGQTIICDETNGTPYLIVSHVAATSITVDRAWTGVSGSQTNHYFYARDDDGNGGTASPTWYYLPYSDLATSTTSPAPSVIVYGSV